MRKKRLLIDCKFTTIALCRLYKESENPKYLYLLHFYVTRAIEAIDETLSYISSASINDDKEDYSLRDRSVKDRMHILDINLR